LISTLGTDAKRGQTALENVFDRPGCWRFGRVLSSFRIDSKLSKHQGRPLPPVPRKGGTWRRELQDIRWNPTVSVPWQGDGAAFRLYATGDHSTSMRE
jgi:hypothetical protein